MTRKWEKAPPDGTNYAYWESDDGFVIETKPRFRPAIPYTLYLPAALQEEDSFGTVIFPTLSAAKEGACWPTEVLRDQARARTAEVNAMFRNGVGSVASS